MVSDWASVGGHQHNAKDSMESLAQKFTEHEVQRGDWLYEIGRRHNVDFRSLLKANPNLINPDSLHVGSRIKIPQASTSSSSSSSVLMPLRQARSSISEPIKQQSLVSAQAQNLSLSKIFFLFGSFLGRDRVHKVVEGDTLERLAEKYSTTVAALRKLNNLQSDIIYSGSVLKIDRANSRRAREAFLGKKASFKERNGLLEGVLETPLPVNGGKLTGAFSLVATKQQKLGPPALKTVKVCYGDTLVDIAKANGLSIRELQRLNHLRDDVIFEGELLVVAADSDEVEVEDIRPGKRRTNRPLFSRHPFMGGGSNYPIGGPALTLKASVASGGIKLEGRWKSKKKGFQQPRDQRLQFSSPLAEGFISSPFGWRWGAFHEGVDLAADQGSPILASDRGVVTFAGWSGGYGYLVSIQHEGGFVTRYAHCCAIHASVGQQVSRGQRVAAVGATGHATGPHLHFEVRRNGEALDPLKWVNL